MLAKSCSINKGKELCQQNECTMWRTGDFTSQFGTEAQWCTWSFLPLQSSDILWNVEWRMWIESVGFCVMCCLIYKSGVHHRENTRWKEQKTGYCSTPSASHGYLSPGRYCLSPSLLCHSLRAHAESEWASHCLDLQAMEAPRGLLASQLTPVQVQRRGWSSLLLCTAVTYELSWNIEL